MQNIPRFYLVLWWREFFNERNDLINKPACLCKNRVRGILKLMGHFNGKG